MAIRGIFGFFFFPTFDFVVVFFFFFFPWFSSWALDSIEASPVEYCDFANRDPRGMRPYNCFLILKQKAFE